MSLLELILIFVLQFEASISGETGSFYQRPGQEVTLPCGSASPSDTTCSFITWFYNKVPSQTLTEVDRGNVKNSARAARLSLGTSCSLIINNITAEDAGLYTCRRNGGDKSVYLSVLTISPSPPDTQPKTDGEVILQCSLFKYADLGPCKQNSIRWVDETGTVLLGEGVGYRFLRQLNCVSLLTVKRQSGRNRKYTCRAVENSDVKVEAEYTPVFIGGRGDDQPGQTKSDQFPDQTFIIIIIGAVVGAVAVLVVIAAVLIKYKKRVKAAADVQKPTQHPDEPENNVTYATVSHAGQRASPKTTVKEEDEVTYSTVKTSAQTEADDDPSSLYSFVSKKPK